MKDTATKQMGYRITVGVCVLATGLAALAAYNQSQIPQPLVAPPPLAQPVRVLLLGSTGAVGTALLAQLVSSPSVASITCVSRRPHPTLSSHPKIKEVIVDMSDPASLTAGLRTHAAALAGHSVAFSTLGAGKAGPLTRAELEQTDHFLPAAFMRAAHAASIPHMSLMTAVLANPEATDSGEITGGGSGTYVCASLSVRTCQH